MAGHHYCTVTFFLIFFLFAVAFAARDLEVEGANNPFPAPAGRQQAGPSYYGYGGGFQLPGGFYGGGGPAGGAGNGIPSSSGGRGTGGGGGWGAGYGGPGGGGCTHGGVEVPPAVVCQEKGPCYGRKVTCPKKCFWSYSRAGNGYGAGGGGGSCTVDCKYKCAASC